MSKKICFADFDRQSVQIEMLSLVRRFFPQSWWPWLTSLMINTLYDFLINKPFGDCLDRLGIMFDGKVLPDDGVCTFVNIDGSKGLLVAWLGGHKFLEWPEWGMGTYQEVREYLTVAVSRTVDPWSEYKAGLYESLQRALVEEFREHRVFEALGILGGVWSPAGGVAPNEKALDNLN